MNVKFLGFVNYVNAMIFLVLCNFHDYNLNAYLIVRTARQPYKKGSSMTNGKVSRATSILAKSCISPIATPKVSP